MLWHKVEHHWEFETSKVNFSILELNLHYNVMFWAPHGCIVINKWNSLCRMHKVKIIKLNIKNKWTAHEIKLIISHA